MTCGWQRRERATPTTATATTMNTLTGVSGVCIGQIPGTGNGGDRGASDNDDNVEEGGSHSTPLTTATRELTVRLCSAGIPYTSEDFFSDLEDVNR